MILNWIESLRTYIKNRFPKAWENRQFAYFFTEQFIVSGVNYASTLLMLTAFPLKDIGIFALLSSVAGFCNSQFSAFVLTPMSAIIPYTPPAQRVGALRGWTLKSVLFMMGTVLFLLGVGSLSGVYFKLAWMPVYLPLVIITTMALMGTGFIKRYFIIEAHYKELLLLAALSSIPQIAILLLLYFSNDLSLDKYIWVSAVTSIVAVLVAFLRVNLFQVKHYREEPLLLSQGTKMGLSNVSQTLISGLCGQIVNPIAAHLLGLEIFGALSAIGRCFFGLNLVAGSVGSFLFSKIQKKVPMMTPRALWKYLKVIRLKYVAFLSVYLLVVGSIGQFFILPKLLGVFTYETCVLFLTTQAIVMLVLEVTGLVELLNLMLQDLYFSNVLKSVWSILSLVVLTSLLRAFGPYGFYLNYLIYVVLINGILYRRWWVKYADETRPIGEIIASRTKANA